MNTGFPFLARPLLAVLHDGALLSFGGVGPLRDLSGGSEATLAIVFLLVSDAYVDARRLHGILYLAERVGFEPTCVLPPTAFQAGPMDQLWDLSGVYLADGVRFELTRLLRARRFSRPLH
jgi:hypothetical protein